MGGREAAFVPACGKGATPPGGDVTGEPRIKRAALGKGNVITEHAFVSEEGARHELRKGEVVVAGFGTSPRCPGGHRSETPAWSIRLYSSSPGSIADLKKKKKRKRK